MEILYLTLITFLCLQLLIIRGTQAGVANFCISSDNYLKLRCPPTKPYITVDWVVTYSSCVYSGDSSCELHGPVTITGSPESDKCDIFNLRILYLCHGVNTECTISSPYLMHPSQYESDYGVPCGQASRPGAFRIKFSCSNRNTGRTDFSRLYGSCRRALIDPSTTPISTIYTTPTTTAVTTPITTEVTTAIATTTTSSPTTTATTTTTSTTTATTTTTTTVPETTTVYTSSSINYTVIAMKSTSAHIVTSPADRESPTTESQTDEKRGVSPETVVVITSTLLGVCLAVSILGLLYAILKRKRKKSKKTRKVIKALPPLPELDNVYAAIGGDFNDSSDEHVLYDMKQYKSDRACTSRSAGKSRSGSSLNNNNNPSHKNFTNPLPTPPRTPPIRSFYEEVQVQTTSSSAQQAHYYSPLETPTSAGAKAETYFTLTPPSNSEKTTPCTSPVTEGDHYNNLHEAISGNTLLNKQNRQEVPTTPVDDDTYYSIPNTVVNPTDSIYEELPYDIAVPVCVSRGDSTVRSSIEASKRTLPARGVVNEAFSTHM